MSQNLKKTIPLQLNDPHLVGVAVVMSSYALYASALLLDFFGR